MNKLPLHKQTLVLSCLVEGMSLRGISRLTGIHRGAVQRLLLEAGTTSERIMAEKMQWLHLHSLECDEIWSYVGKKQRNCTPEEKRGTELGDQYTFVALDQDTKLVPAYYVGRRSIESTNEFMEILSRRVVSNVQITTDGWTPYYAAIDTTFGGRAAYSRIVKVYHDETKHEKRYSPASIIDIRIEKFSTLCDPERISTSYVERQNLTMRMQMRRFTRLTNAFSKKLDNLKAAVSLHFFHYNFMRVHQTLRVTPAMEAGIAKQIMGWEMLLGETNAIKQAA